MTISGPVYPHERAEYYGQVGDTRPGPVPVGSRYIEYTSDDSATTVYFSPDGFTWKTLAKTNG